MRWKKVFIVLLMVFILAFAGMAFGFSYSVTDEEKAAQFITANPLDLSKIVAFSQYRSCAGHDYRGPTAQGTVERSPRSLKHYVKVIEDLRGTIDVVPVFAPFDGTISVIDEDLGGPTDQQIWLTPTSINPRQWHFVFFHINLDPSFKKGSTVTAGQRIGFANLARGPEGKTDNFDIAAKFTRPMHRPAVDTPFAHMAPEVISEYAEVGIAPDALILAEQYRDERPCPLLPKGEGGDGPDIYFPPEAGQDEYIFFR